MFISPNGKTESKSSQITVVWSSSRWRFQSKSRSGNHEFLEARDAWITSKKRVISNRNQWVSSIFEAMFWGCAMQASDVWIRTIDLGFFGMMRFRFWSQKTTQRWLRHRTGYRDLLWQLGLVFEVVDEWRRRQLQVIRKRKRKEKNKRYRNLYDSIEASQVGSLLDFGDNLEMTRWYTWRLRRIRGWGNWLIWVEIAVTGDVVYDHSDDVKV